MRGKRKNEQFVWGGLHPFSYHPFVFNFIPNLEDKIIVDCGCGRGVWGYLIRATRPIGSGKIIGIDLDKNYLDFCRKYNIYDKLINGDISKLPFRNKSVDFLICSEVIEHLSLKKGLRFLEEVDRVMKEGGRAIITTPNIKIETVLGGKDSHHSIWGVNEFKRRNFKVYGIGLKLSPNLGKWYTPLVHALHYFFTPISFWFPGLAGFLIAVKDFNEKK